MNNMKQTSIEWLFENLWDEPKDKLTWHSILNKATEIHKQEIIDAATWGGLHKSGETYYELEFKQPKKD
jgi:hypothetical protein